MVPLCERRLAFEDKHPAKDSSPTSDTIRGLKEVTKITIIDGIQFLREGDMITEANGSQMKNFYDLILYIQRNKRLGDQILLTAIR